MLTRILLRLIFLAGLATPLSVLALGVGPIEVRSALNQNFEADMPLIVNNPAELTGLIVRIPRQQDFDQVGIERLALLAKLRFAVPKPGEPPIVRITSQEPIREPNFNLLLEVIWPRGRLLREFPIQLDPELYANRRPPPPVPILPPLPAIAAAPAAPAAPPVPDLPAVPPVSFEGATFYGPVKPGETLRAIANRVRPSTAISLPNMMAILVAGNSEAFANGNPNALRAGSMLKVPTPQALGAPAAPPGSAPAPSPELATPIPAEPAPVAVTESPIPVAPSAPAEPFPPPLAPAEPFPPPPVAAPVAVAPLPAPTEPPREIVPQASIPEPAPPPEPAKPAAEPVLAQPAPPPEPAKPAPIAKPSAPAIETEASWMDNPVVWIAMALIVLAVGAMLLLPLLRRTARPKSAASPEKAGSGEVGSATQIQPSQPRTKRTQPMAEPAAAPRPAAELAPKPAAAAMPKPINDLLRDIDLGLDTEQLALASGKGAPPAPLPKLSRLPDAEPPTAPISREAGPAAASTLATLPQMRTPAPPPPSQAMDLPSDLRLDGMDFNFGDLAMDAKPARSQPDELPALELRPSSPAVKPAPADRGLSMELEGFDPFAEPSSIAGAKAGAKAVPVSTAPAAPPPSQKFEFSDVTQDYKKAAQDDSFRLDEELSGLSSGTLELGQMDIGSDSGATSADYVETKLDLATAYLDMGDQVGARSLLEDVQREGDASQKNRAGELLKKMG